MRPMLLAFLTLAVVTVAAPLVLSSLGFSAAEQGANPSAVRLN